MSSRFGSRTIYGRGAERVHTAEVGFREAKERLRLAKAARAHGTAAIRFRDWAPRIKQSFGAWLSGDQLAFHFIAHEGSYGRFMRAVVEAEGERGHIGGATFYRTLEDMVTTKREAGPAWKGEAIYRPR